MAVPLFTLLMYVRAMYVRCMCWILQGTPMFQHYALSSYALTCALLNFEKKEERTLPRAVTGKKALRREVHQLSKKNRFLKIITVS